MNVSSTSRLLASTFPLWLQCNFILYKCNYLFILTDLHFVFQIGSVWNCESVIFCDDQTIRGLSVIISLATLFIRSIKLFIMNFMWECTYINFVSSPDYCYIDLRYLSNLIAIGTLCAPDQIFIYCMGLIIWYTPLITKLVAGPSS